MNCKRSFASSFYYMHWEPVPMFFVVFIPESFKPACASARAICQPSSASTQAKVTCHCIAQRQQRWKLKQTLMRKRKSVAIVRKCTFINMASMVAMNVDNKALVGELALLDNVAILSKDATLLSNVALLGKIAALGKLAFLDKVAILGKFTSWQSRGKSPSSVKLPLKSSPASCWH